MSAVEVGIRAQVGVLRVRLTRSSRSAGVRRSKASTIRPKATSLLSPAASAVNATRVASEGDVLVFVQERSGGGGTREAAVGEIEILSQELQETRVQWRERREQWGARGEAVRREQIDEAEEAAQEVVVADSVHHLSGVVSQIDYESSGLDAARFEIRVDNIQKFLMTNRHH